ncbi:lysine--tRNA ligase [Candidatus Berkelbacteria bacterium]|nr:lysine--tRNA ligase [Candidatus Berkelbacteria bacterium]
MNKFWAEELAQTVLDRHAEPYVVSDWKTPSGHIHVGALRGVLLHDAIAKTISSLGKQVRYIYGFDDYDSMDKLPNYLSSDYERYLGQSFSTIPAPDEQGRPGLEATEESNYGRFFADQFESVYRGLGVQSETLRTSVLYRDGFLNLAIKIALNQAEDIKAVFKKINTNRTEGREVIPFKHFPINIVCENCHKIATTEATDWDGEVVGYQCIGVNFAPGCSHKGKASPYNGGAKLPWKVEWAAKFFLFKTDLEGGGKDHYTKGGSRDVANEIFRSVYAPHLDSQYARVPTDLFYEWLLIEGRKMATSKGLGDTAFSVAGLLPANALRFLLVRTKPKTAFSFKLSLESTLRLYDQFDQYLKKFHEDPTSAEGKAFQLSMIDKKAPDFVPKMSSLIYLLQLPNIDLKATLIKDKGAPLSEIELSELEQRIEVAKKLISELPSDERIVLQKILPVNISLNANQKEFLTALAASFSVLDSWDGLRVHEEIHVVRKSMAIEPKLAFEALYRIFLNRESGPQAGWFLANLDRNFVIKRLQEAGR